jgi:hypothetical protein
MYGKGRAATPTEAQGPLSLSPAVHSVPTIINSKFYIVEDKITTFRQILRFYSYASSRQTYDVRISSVQDNGIGYYAS